jgi:tricorn protease
VAVRGYYRHPAVFGDRVVFVSEDDLWSVPAAGGVATRLTANPGAVSFPRFSPDGGMIAFTSRDEGRLEVHVMDAGGGPARRLTFFGATSHPVGWRPDGSRVVVASDAQRPFEGWLHLWDVPLDGSQPRPLGLGPARAISFGRGGRPVVIGRNSFDPARWKRYRGGRAGSIWVDRRGDGAFTELVDLPGNLADPMWLGGRIYFLSDHEGVGNLYSVTPAGRDLVRHTHHEDFYARFPSSDGRTIVYHCGADLWRLEAAGAEPVRLEVEVPSARPQLNRRFVPAAGFLEAVDLHPRGHSVALTVRGGAYSMPLWEGAPARLGSVSRHRQRLATWLPDGERIVSVSDEPGEECLVVRPFSGDGETQVVERDLGRIRSIDPAPAGAARVAVTNHRHELHLVDLTRRTARLVHRSPHTWIAGTAWSPDGRWLAFSAATTRTTMNLFLYDTATRRLHQVGRPESVDHSPCFDQEGRYLQFLSARVFDPVPDSVFHDYGFPRSTVPMLIPLAASQPSPFRVAGREPRPPGAPPGPPPPEPKPGDPPPAVTVDLDGLAARAQAFPVPPARYVRVAAARGRTLLLSLPVSGSLGSAWSDQEPPKGRLEAWDFTADRLEPVADGVTGLTTSRDGKVMALLFGRKLRVVPAGWKEDKNGKDAATRETGWIDLGRIQVEVVPQDEWRQMFTEAWRLQRDSFWWEDMGGVDWLEVHDRYLSLVDRVASRAEFSDLLWEMQGELGTSHAYELGGDYRPEPAWTLGMLGADLGFDRGAWRVERIPRGDSWDPQASSPLASPGLGIGPGDRILAVDGVALGRTRPPASALVDKGGRAVALTVGSGRRRPRRVVVTALTSEWALRYRDWVEANRSAVRELSEGRAGYIHIPDMQAWGFSEFHRAWRAELDLDGLVVDVRFNRGGNVSQLLLQKLVRRRLGYRVTRWREPAAFPYDAPMGPMVCLTNEMAGSDGDIFSHTFKLLGLGPLIGTRTWGGVVGIWPQQALVDGTVTTQPEFGTWFSDVGYRVENYGTDPDIEVVITPSDYLAGRDPQLERGVAELLRIVAAAGPPPLELGPAPSVRPPRLPR